MEPKSKRSWNTIDELVALMKENKRQSKIESEEMFKTKEFQDFFKRLSEKSKLANELSV
jgi:hypothetical protein